MRVFRHLILAICCFYSFSSFAQKEEIDVLIDSTSKSLRDPFLTIELSDSILKLSEFADYSYGIGAGSKFKGIGLYYSGSPDSAMIYYDRSLAIFLELNDSLEIGKAYLNRAIVFNARAEYNNAVEQSLQALNYFKGINDLNGAGRVLNIIGQSYYFQSDYEEALNYFKRYLDNSLEVGDSVEISSSLSNVGAAFLELDQIDSSIFYTSKAIALKERLNFLGNIGTSYYNIAQLLADQKEYNRASSYFDKALNHYTELNDTTRLAELYLSIGEMEFNRNRIKSSLSNALKALRFSQVSDNREIEKNTYDMLALIYSTEGDYQSAYSALKEFIQVNDSILNTSNLESLNRLREEFQTKEKEQQISLQESQLSQQQAKLQRNQVLIAALILVAVLLVTLYMLNRSQSKRKELLIRKDAELKVREAEINAVINSQEKERNRFAQDLHDGFGQLISVLKLSLSDVKKLDSKDTDKRQEIYKNGESIINEMYAELRNICFDLMPQTLVKRGLTPALKEFGSRINQTDKINCEVLVFNNTARLKEVYEISLFRITQEWINNVLKYANADHITIQMTKEEVELTLTVEDNGNGFDPTVFYNGSGNGWRNIQSRLKLIQGEFDLDSRSGVKGTLMTVNIPLTSNCFIPASTEREITE